MLLLPWSARKGEQASNLGCRQAKRPRLVTATLCTFGLILLASVFQSPFQGHQQLAPVETDTRLSAISGEVMDAATGLSLGGATISLNLSGKGVVRRQRVDEKGRFAFAELAPGSYRLSAENPGYADARFGPSSMGALGASIVLDPGEWFGRAVVMMEPLGSISGFVTDETRRPVVGAYVRAIALLQIAGSTRFVAGPLTTTDDRGFYRIGNLRSGSYLVLLPWTHQSVPSYLTTAAIEGMSDDRLAAIDASTTRGGGIPKRLGGLLNGGLFSSVIGNVPWPPSGPGGRLRVYTPTMYPGVSSLDASIAVDLKETRHRTDIDIPLAAQTAVRVAGRLDGPGISTRGVVLRLLPKGFEDLGPGFEAATAAVALDGSFEFQGVASGDYTILGPDSVFGLRLEPVRAFEPMIPIPHIAGMSTSGRYEGPVALNSHVSFVSHYPNVLETDTGLSVRMNLSVGEADSIGLVVPAQPLGSVKGGFQVEGGTKVDARGTLEIVEIVGSAARTARRLLVNIGEPFSVRGLIPGEYVIRLVGMPLTMTSVVADGADVTRRTVNVIGGATTDIVVRVSPRSSSVTGTVRDNRGQVVPAAIALFFPVDRSLWTGFGYTPTWIRTAIADSRGFFRMSNLRPGEYHVVGLTPEEEARWTDPEFLRASSTGGTRLSIVPGAPDSQELALVIKK